MVTKEECEAMGKTFVKPHKNGKGGWTKGYCRDVSNPLMTLNNGLPQPSYEDFYPAEPLSEPSNLMEFEDTEDLEGKRYKLPRSNLINAKIIKKDISSEDRKIGRDLREQDFEDIPYQSSRIVMDAEKEAKEASKLEESQKVRAKSHYANQKNKISKRETRETKNRIKKEKSASKRAIRTEKKRIRHEKKEAKRESKLEKLKNKE